jgi:membrane-associated phospholipid phosphatase
LRILVWAYVIPMLVILAAGALLVLRYSPDPMSEGGWLSGPRGFLVRVRSGFGRVSGTLLALAAGAGVIIAIGWPIGYGARKFTRYDHKVYNWVLPRSHTHWLHSSMSTLTKMSNNRETQVVCAIFMVVLTAWWFRHRRGLGVLIPAALILAAYEIEHQLQHVLKVLAARTGPVPAGVGAYPSGGVARLISVYGLIIYLVLRRTKLTRTKWAVGAWSVLALAVYTEAYSRLYLGKHWISDIVGGLVFGGLLLVLFIAMTKLLDEPDPGPGPEPDDTSGTPKRIFAGSQY